MDHYEFAIGTFLENDELFNKCQSSLNPDKFLESDLKTLISTMKNYGNSIESIYKHAGKDIALYAIYLANHVAQHKIDVEHQKHLPIQPFSDWCDKVFFKKDYDFDEAKESPYIHKSNQILNELGGIRTEEEGT